MMISCLRPSWTCKRLRGAKVKHVKLIPPSETPFFKAEKEREGGRGQKDCSGRQCGGNGCAVAWVWQRSFPMTVTASVGRRQSTGGSESTALRQWDAPSGWPVQSAQHLDHFPVLWYLPLQEALLWIIFGNLNATIIADNHLSTECLFSNQQQALKRGGGILALVDHWRQAETPAALVNVKQGSYLHSPMGCNDNISICSWKSWNTVLLRVILVRRWAKFFGIHGAAGSPTPYGTEIQHHPRLHDNGFKNKLSH